MGRKKENPRYHVISFRVNDQEKAFITEFAAYRDGDIGEFMRMLLDDFVGQILPREAIDK